MMFRLLLFAHLLGVVILGGALIHGQLHQLRARRSDDLCFIAGTYRTLYLTVMPFAPIGGILLLATGAALIAITGRGAEIWLIALIALFAFEMIEGITHYLPHARQLMRLSREALARGQMTPELRRRMNDRVSNFLLYLDIPMFLLIASLATFKPF